jgi:hypothetical protein
MTKPSISEVVREWFEDDQTMFDACAEAPEVAWADILEILQHELTDEQTALLAGGPLETSLAWHGTTLIDRVERQAQQSPRFNHLLGGVCRTRFYRRFGSVFREHGKRYGEPHAR